MKYKYINKLNKIKFRIIIKDMQTIQLNGFCQNCFNGLLSSQSPAASLRVKVEP